jgi:protein involved in temperature-dependent protein secretion
MLHKLPVLLGGGLSRARNTYQAAVNLSPSNTVTRIFFAELLIETGEWNAAIEHLEFVVRVETDPYWAFEVCRDKKIATEMLSRLTTSP